MKIKSLKAKVIGVETISPTAKEVRLALPVDLEFIPGAFVNVFAEINGKKERRAYSISSSSENQREVALSIRILPTGKLSPIFLEKDIVGKELQIMGPLGLNTADKIKSKRIFLIGYGIGISPIKSLAHHFAEAEDTKELSILTGSRSREEVIYDEFFKQVTKLKNGIYRPVISDMADKDWPRKGFVQDHIDDIDFSNSAVYICGQGEACRSAEAKIREKNPDNCEILVEDFH